MTWPVGKELGDGRLFAAAAERNRDPILAVLARTLPERGLVLEVGSGTGQHVVHFAKALPKLAWQPSDPDPAYRDSISQWIRHEGLSNVTDPIALDIRERPWPVAAADAVLCINVVHVSPWTTALALLDGARAVLPPNGVLCLYGPYSRGGRHTAPSNERFDADLRTHDSEWGVRDVDDVAAAASGVGLELAEIVPMPANNFSLILVRR